MIVDERLINFLFNERKFCLKAIEQIKHPLALNPRYISILLNFLAISFIK